MQQGEHEIISDDGLMQLYFTQVDAANELLPAHWHEHGNDLYAARGNDSVHQ